MKNTTLDYYAANAEAFAAQTQQVYFSDIQEQFADIIPAGAFILDFGCGAGRDTKVFLEKGFQVEAWDGSAELCRLASDYTGIEVKHRLFQELSCSDVYDGIWACSSILHLPADELRNVLEKISKALKPGGVLYTSFKYGDFSGERNGRFFTDFKEDSFEQLLAQIPDLSIIKSWRTGDVRPGREAEQWLNLLLRKSL